MLLYEMLIGQSPFSGCDEDELFWSICNEMPSYPRFLSQESLNILTRVSSSLLSEFNFEFKACLLLFGKSCEINLDHTQDLKPLKVKY